MFFITSASRKLYAFLSFLFLSLLLSTSANAVENRLSPLGINTNEIMDIDSSVPFVDLFKLSAPFEEARPWLTKGKIDYDENGWPSNLNGGQAGTRFINNIRAASIPKGVYTVLYKGRGKIRYGGNVRLLRHYPGRDLIEFRPNKEKRITATVMIMETDPKNHIRDLHVLIPGGICKHDPMRRVRNKKECKGKPYLAFTGHHKRVIFNPAYLSFMKDFRVIRLMNMSGITRNNLTHWEDRPKINNANWGGKEGTRGVPLEIMIKLVNIIGADPWFSLPHRADDNFIEQYARVLKQQLKPELKAYIEYTNEAWNGIFTQAHYVKDRGTILGLDKNRTYAGFKYYSKRSVDIFKIFEKEFGNTNQLVRVMGGMATNVPMTHMILGYEDAFRHVDALAIAPYFHGTQEAQKALGSVDDVFRMLRSWRNKYSMPRTLQMVKMQSRMTNRYGIDLIAYEGGQHLVSYKTHKSDEGPNPHLIAANKDDRMAKLYLDFLTGWKASGGKLFVAFSAPRDYNWIGSWGIKEYITQSANVAPKYRGLMYFQKTNRCWWYGCATTNPIARKRKPAWNPAAGVMARRFKEGVPQPAEVVLAKTRAKRKAHLDAQAKKRIVKINKKKKPVNKHKIDKKMKQTIAMVLKSMKNEEQTDKIMGSLSSE